MDRPEGRQAVGRDLERPAGTVQWKAVLWAAAFVIEQFQRLGYPFLMAAVIFPVSVKPLKEEHERRSLRVLMMVHELHKVGYQRLRIYPGMSSSGGSWRCSVTPVTNILKRHGATAKEWNEQVATYTSGMGNEFFGWKDAQTDSARELAVKFIERYARIVDVSKGEDWAFAGWFVQMLGYAERGDFPITYADFTAGGNEPPPRFLPTTKHWYDSTLLLPPGGLHYPVVLKQSEWMNHFTEGNKGRDEQARVCA